MHRALIALLLAISAAIPSTPAAAGSASVAAGTVMVEVDATDTARGIERTHLTVPVKPGALTLLYPKWLPGEHSPDGPISGLSGLRFTANGRPLAWRRDLENMFAFHLQIPAGVSSLEVNFEILSVQNAANHNAQRTSTESLAVVLWNRFVLYPAGAASDDLQYTAQLRLPEGWSCATALPGGTGAGRDGRSSRDLQFRTVSLTTLVDSPVLIGRFLKTISLGGSPDVQLHLAADSSAALAIPDATVAALHKLVSEAAALFGATHFTAGITSW